MNVPRLSTPATLAIVLLAIATTWATAQPAAACSPVQPFGVYPELLLAGDHNEPGGQLDLAYQSFTGGDDGATPHILGVYRVEVVATVDPVVVSEGGWFSGPREVSRGSVAVVTQYHGQAPPDLGPFAIGRPEVWERTASDDGCDHLSYPVDRDVGSVDWLILTDGAPLDLLRHDGFEEAVTAALGPAVTPDRDPAAEQALLDELQAEHDTAVAQHTGQRLFWWGLALAG